MPVFRHVLLSAPLVAVALLLGACGGGGSDTVSVSEQSDDRSTTSNPAPSAGSDYCDAADAANGGGSGLDLSDDPRAALDSVRALAAAAPPELQDDFDTFIDGIDDIAEMDEESPEALATIFELMADPEFAAASDAIEEYTKDECGIELGAAMPSGDDSSASGADSGSDESDDSEPGEIELDDVSAIKEANASSAWADKLSTTAINGLADVQVSTSGDDLSQAEALQACTALLAELSKINPEVTVSVGNGADVLAKSGGGTCAAA
jgi:hypothetical protein